MIGQKMMTVAARAASTIIRTSGGPPVRKIKLGSNGGACGAGIGGSGGVPWSNIVITPRSLASQPLCDQGCSIGSVPRNPPAHGAPPPPAAAHRPPPGARDPGDAPPGHEDGRPKPFRQD